MRITNSMMINSSLANIATNKTQMSTLDTQLSTKKKISRPSEDPVVAIRALRLRSSLTEVTQYLEKNIPDADAWMKVTEGALAEVDDMFRDVIEYCNQGSSDQFETDDRQTIINCLAKLKDSIYAQGNVDYAGRYVFTGYKTDSTLTFTTQADAQDKKYTITEPIKTDDIYLKTVIKDSVDATNVTFIDNADMPSSEQVYTYKLAYKNLSDSTEGPMQIRYDYDENGNAASTIAVTSTVSTDADAYVVGDDEVKFLADTGELVMGSNVYASIRNADDLTIDYDKNGFNKDEIKPEHYFTCIDKTDAAEPVEYIKAKNGQDINYNISYSQKIKVNTEASDALSYRIGVDLEMMEDSLDRLSNIEDKIGKLEAMKKEAMYADEDSQKALDSMLEAANKERDIAKNDMRELFDKSITKFQNHQEKLDYEIADIGSRGVRLSLTKSRLTEQQTTIKSLKSENEDIDYEDIVIDYSSAELIYEAALQSAGKVVRQSLLDFL